MNKNDRIFTLVIKVWLAQLFIESLKDKVIIFIINRKKLDLKNYKKCQNFFKKIRYCYFSCLLWVVHMPIISSQLNLF